MIKLNPNCSEVVFRLDEDEYEQVEKLKKEGIYTITIPSNEFWKFDHDNRAEDYPLELLVDVNNNNMPDLHGKARMSIRTDNLDGMGKIIQGHQHCQHQMFETMYRISEILEATDEDGCGWSGFDGGSICDFEDWVAKGRKKIKNYSDDSRQRMINKYKCYMPIELRKKYIKPIKRKVKK